MSDSTLPLLSPDNRDDPGVLRNRLFDDIELGACASLERTLGAADIRLFAVATADASPAQLDAAYAAASPQREVVAQHLWSASLFSTILLNQLPGPGTVIEDLDLRFHAPVVIGDTLRAQVCVSARDPHTRRLTLTLTCCKQDGTQNGTQSARDGIHEGTQDGIRTGAQDGMPVVSGSATVIAPDLAVALPRIALPRVQLIDDAGGLHTLLDAARALAPVRTAVVHPCDAVSLQGALDAYAAGLIVPVLVAPRARLESVAAANGIDLRGIEIDDVPHSHAAAERGAALAGSGQVQALMKGSLHTDELMAAVVAAAAGLRTERRISHCFVIDTPFYPRPFLITDAAINIAPDLAAKVDIVRNAIDLATVLGVPRPRVAILAAVETVNPQMRATLDAAALCKMAERGQITGADLDGPLAFDNAISAAAARVKGIVSSVAGRADILVVPDLESGNMLAKQLEYLGGAKSAGIVLGARVPIILTSRADSREARVASAAVAVLIAHHHS
ncbi:MAG: bifunctional enoyl-CoA hydratase/phosphate acetyltransferase [Janthinobacterium lividum]